jgi:hypothetical protein
MIINAFFLSSAYGGMQVLLRAKEGNKKIPDLSGKNHYGILKGGINIFKTQFIFNGKNSGIHLNDSKDINIKNGASYVAIVKFSDLSKNTYDAVIYKHRQFVLAKKGNLLYCNFFNGKKWCTKLYSSGIVPNRWYHLTLTFERHVAVDTGENWTQMKLYINGRCISKIKRNYMYPTDSREPIQIGKADGFGNVWHLNGAIGEIRIYDKTLSSTEIEKLFENQNFVKPNPDTSKKLSSKELNILKQIRVMTTSSSERDRMARALIYALDTVGKIRNSGIVFSRYADRLKQAITKNKNSTQLLNDWNSIDKIKTISNQNMCFTYIYDPVKHKFIFVNIYNYRTGRNLFKVGSRLWKVHIKRFGQGYLFHSTTNGLQAQLLEKPVKNNDCWRFKLQWTHPYFIAQSQFSFSSKRLEYNLNVAGRSSTSLIKEVTFPSMRLKQLKQDKDFLLVPAMSGVEYPEPIKQNTSYIRVYPSKQAVMQFGAYYDAKGGLYFATEDIRAQTKTLSFVPGNKSVQVEYLWNVGYKPGEKNSFNPKCKAVFEIMNGNWYDAGLIYRRFLSNSKPVWWTEKLPRKDTPIWFKNNSLWFRQWVKKDNFEKLEKKFYAALNYFEMPFAIHWYSWHGKHDQDYPHYSICPEFHSLMKRLQAKNIKIIPYVNGRIWDTKDRGDEDWQYSKIAFPATAKNPEGKVYTSIFKKRLFAIMCPYTELWQRKLLEVSKKVLNFGFNGIYWDQVAAAPPVLCYDKNHGHLLGDCDLWFMKGNYKIFSKIRKLSKKKYSDIASFSEDNAEPYSRVFDGVLCWRWMYKTQVPLFQLIYSGRLQFIGLHYSLGYEDKNARFSKTAKQLVYSEQMGWFTIRDLVNSNKNYRLFLKKAIHVRKAMLKFFNEGMMERPVKFLKKMKVYKRKWGKYETRYVDSPEIVSCVWKYKNMIAYLMVNTLNKKVSQKIAFDSLKYGMKTKEVKVNIFCSESKSKNFKTKGKFEKNLDFSPYSIQLWLISPDNCNSQIFINKIKKIFKKINNFSIASDSL